MENKAAEQRSPVSNDLNMFGSSVAYFYQEESATADYDKTFAKFMFVAQDGICLESPEDIQASPSRLTHVFVANAEFDHDKLKQMIESLGTENLAKIKVMRYQWILDCDEQKTLISDETYKINV